MPCSFLLVFIKMNKKVIYADQYLSNTETKNKYVLACAQPL